MWVLETYLCFVWLELTPPVQLEESEAQRLDSEVARCYVCTVVCVLFVGFCRKRPFFPHVLNIQLVYLTSQRAGLLTRIWAAVIYFWRPYGSALSSADIALVWFFPPFSLHLITTLADTAFRAESRRVDVYSS